MKPQQQVVATVALATLGFAAATPVVAFPSRAIEYSQLEYMSDAGRSTQHVMTAASVDRAFPSTSMEPATPTSGSGIDG